MDRLVGWALAGTVVFALSGCGGGGDGSDGGLRLEIGSRTWGAPGHTADIYIKNDSTSSYAICEVYSVPHWANSWGDNQINGTIAPNAKAKYTTHSCQQRWDLKVVDCKGHAAEKLNYCRPCHSVVKFTATNW